MLEFTTLSTYYNQNNFTVEISCLKKRKDWVRMNESVKNVLSGELQCSVEYFVHVFPSLRKLFITLLVSFGSILV